MIWLYRLILNLAIPLALIGLALRGFKNSAYWSRWSERFGFVPNHIKRAAPFDLWIHAVSVGEARAATPLVNRLLNEQPDTNILLTTTTPTGSAMVAMMLQDKVSHCYFPYDLGWAMRNFVAAVQARTVLVMETEIWPNMIEAVKRSGSTLVYTNVRLSEDLTRVMPNFQTSLSVLWRKSTFLPWKEVWIANTLSCLVWRVTKSRKPAA